MNAGEWIALGTLVVALLGLVWGGFTWLIDLILKQSKETIAELKEDRNELREENQELRNQLQEQEGGE